MRRRSISRCAAFALGLACSGCAATVLPRANEPVDTVVARGLQAMPSERVRARVEQSGSSLTLSATRACDLHRVRTVDRAELHRVVNDVSQMPARWTIAAGAALGTAGIVTCSVALATSERHLARDLTTGGLLSAAGAVVVGVGVAVFPSAGKAEVRRTRVDVDEGVESENAPCPAGVVAARAAVTGRMVGPKALEIPFGDTDERGAMVIELADALPPTVYRDAPTGAKLTLYVGDSEVGIARLDEVANAVEERAWPIGAAEACATTSADDPCGKIERHLRDFPTGHHAVEAQSVLARASAGLPARKRAEEAEKIAAARTRKQQEESAGKEEAAAEAARRGAAAACRQICAASCKGASTCISTCVERSCP